MMDVLPIPPVPIRAIDVKFSAELTILWTNASRPKKTLGGGGGNSPWATLDVKVRRWVYRKSRLLTCFQSG